jgi:hypothetical protein
VDAGLVLILIAATVPLGIALYVLYAAIDQSLTGRMRQLPLPRLGRGRRALYRSVPERRRSNDTIVFPAKINGRLIREDRRKGERRRARR